VDAPLRILFIEDVPTEVELALRQFAQHGVACDWRRVDTEPDLREQLATFRPQVVLSDFSMPQLDGWTALTRVHASDPDLPFLFVSGTIGEEGAIEALRHGAMDYILKGNLARLVPAVQRALREVELRREQQRAVQQLRDIVGTSQDWIWELDAERRIVFTSPSVEATLGRPPEAILQSVFLELVTADQRAAVDAELNSLNAESRAARCLVQCTALDGHRRWLETNVLALIGDDSRVVGFRGSSRDVTEREQQQRRLAHLRRILRMVSGVNGALVRLRDRDELLQETCRIAVSVGGYVSAVVSLVEPEQTLRVVVVAGTSSATTDTRLPLTSEKAGDLSVSARAVLERMPVVVRDVRDPAVGEITRVLSASTVCAAVALPLVVDGTVVGSLALGAGAAGLLDDRELQLLQELAANVSFALQYLERQHAIHHLSYFDQLTGLAKRTLFCERLEQRLARRVGPEARPAVVVLDLERLGVVNDSAGRHVGDGLLQRVTDRLRRHVDDADCLASLGGGTFALVFPLLGSPEDALSFLHDRISRLLVKPFEIDGHTIRAAARCGIARYPEDGEDPTSLVEHAEAALKSAKAAGESFLPYRLQMNHGQHERLGLEQRLRVAIEERQFVLHYQPQVDIGSGRITALEALLRWNEPGRGLVAPGQFLPILEATQLIIEVGDWVIDEALADLRVWVAQGLQVRVAVNVSPWQLRQRNFADRVLSRLGSTSNRGRSGLDIEITEGALLQDSDDALSKLSSLQAAGVGVAIDDFGTGYSSLSRLALLPVDTLKIDRSFIMGLPTDDASVALVSTVIALARAFSLTTVAEGVETNDQLRILRELGCQQSQGYLHSRPQPTSEITSLLEQERSKRRDVDAEPVSDHKSGAERAQTRT
jgi:diguanylate cyclase (GGDEF)-like protein/PAS domain S-box-containing protein